MKLDILEEISIQAYLNGVLSLPDRGVVTEIGIIEKIFEKRFSE
jgi:hypothetical protein